MKMDLTNQKFGRLTAKKIVRTVPGKGNIWRCECECGGEKEVPAAYLRNGHTRSCGCLNKEREERLDITGQRWGRLTAVRLVRYEDIEGIIAHIETLTEERRKEFAMYLRNNGGTI